MNQALRLTDGRRDRVRMVLEQAGVYVLDVSATPDQIEAALRRVISAVEEMHFDGLERATVRVALVEQLKVIGVRGGAQWVDAALALSNGHLPGMVEDAESWPEQVEGTTLLTAMESFLARFVALPPNAAPMLAAFTVATHAQDAFDVAPYVALLSPTFQCGKTRLLEVLDLLVARSWFTGLVTPAVLFRKLERDRPALLLDEAEVVRGRGDAADAVRALLQGGYRRGMKVPRCDGDDHAIREFDVFGPKVFAAIGDLPGPLLDRCISVTMRRRRRDEVVARFRRRRVSDEALILRRMARRWSDDHHAELAAFELTPPDFLTDRAAEVWEPLFAVGTVAGGTWPTRLHDAAQILVRARSEDGEPSAGLLLLADLRELFRAKGVDRLPSADIIAALGTMEDRPWPEWRNGKPITARQLARLLAPFQIAPKAIRVDDKTPRGYLREQFADALARYAPLDPQQPQQATGDAEKPESVTRNSERAVAGADSGESSDGDCTVAGVADQTGGLGEEVDTEAAEERAAIEAEGAA